MNSRAPAILDHLASLADTTRSRILLLLDRHELTVSELCGIMQLPQSTVSRHLKALADSGWISARAEGTSHLYTMTREELDGAGPPALAAGPRACRSQRRGSAGPAPSSGDARRTAHEVAGVFLPRRSVNGIASATSCSAIVSTSRRLPLCADRAWVVGDLGCGTGTVSAALAPFVARVVAVDGSAPMLQAAKKRLQQFDNVDLRRGELESLPIDDEAARCGDADARAASRCRSPIARWQRRCASSKPGARRARRHAAARSRQLSAADGARVARVQRRAHAAAR